MREVVVGHDNRASSPALAEAAVDGLIRAGCDVTDIGLVATPVVYWCAVEAGNIGGMMVTGSHLKPVMNGFKLSVGMRNLYGDQITGVIRHDRQQTIWRLGKGTATADDSANERYLAMLESKLHPRPPAQDRGRRWKRHGRRVRGAAAGSARSPRDPACTASRTAPIRNHQPDPQDANNLRDLVATVREHGADLGLAFDGDADRVGVVDDQGTVIPADRVLVLLARDTLKRHPGATMVADVLSTQVLV